MNNDELERRFRALQQQRDTERKRNDRALGKAQQRIEQLETALGRVAQLSPAEMRVPSWARPKKRVRAKAATPVLMISDLHLDEVVDEAEMDGLNRYNREEAQRRWERVMNVTPELLRDYTSGVVYDGLLVPLLGDIITGNIHEELTKTNESTVPATIVHWVPRIAAGLKHLADELDLPIWVPCVDGNHDRTGRRIQYKNRAEESWAWIIYHWLADALRDDDRIQFTISKSPEQRIEVYSTAFLLAHGDAPRGGDGIGGIYPPIMRWVHKKQSSFAAERRRFDYALIGHWHQLVYGQNVIINGSMKGYDEYARGNAFGFERPRQALFLVTPGRGITTRTEVFCD